MLYLKNEIMNLGDFLHADCDAIIFGFGQHRTLYLWLLNASLQQLYLLDALAVAGRVLWNRICLSSCSATWPVVFLELDHQISLNFAMVLETLIKLCVTGLGFLGKRFWPLNREKWAKNRVFEFEGTFGH